MLGRNPYALAAKTLIIMLAAAGLLVTGYRYGDYYRGLECEIAVAAAQHAADRALTDAIQEKAAVESRLADVRYQIEVNNAKRQTEIDEALNVNRRLASSLRLRKPASCPGRADAVPENSGAAAGDNEADPVEFSGACSRFLADLAADADRVREQAVAGRAWAIKLHQEFSK